MATSALEQREIVRRVSEEAWGGGDLSLVDEYIAEDIVSHNPNLGTTEGREAYKAFITSIRDAFPDLSVTVQELVEEDDTVVARVSMSGTHEGEFMDIEPTGKECSVDGVVFVRFEDGMAVEEWGIEDMLGLLQQIGAMDGA